MSQISAYLHFDGNCREAMTFYQGCLGEKLAVQTVGESPMAAQMPADSHKKILHSTLTNGGMTFMASDMMGPEGLKRGNGISLTIVCSGKTEIETFFRKLSAGGNVGHALKEEFFGMFGDLTDKYGITWMLQLDPQPKA